VSRFWGGGVVADMPQMPGERGRVLASPPQHALCIEADFNNRNDVLFTVAMIFTLWASGRTDALSASTMFTCRCR
jgi:hypothetical protein